MAPDEADAVAAPKPLLHDHLDGGLRVSTIIELADRIGWTLPRTEPDELQAWFTAGAATKDLLQYLATFDHTLAVMQTAEAIERVAYEAAVDLAADGVVYAEVRFAPELHVAGGLALEAVVEAVTAGFRRGERDARSPISVFAILAVLGLSRVPRWFPRFKRAGTVYRRRDEIADTCTSGSAPASRALPPRIQTADQNGRRLHR